MRCFIAIDIGEEVRKALQDLQQELQSKSEIKKSDVKWVNPDAVHLTLKFLGEIKDTDVIEVCNIVRDVTSRHKSFYIEIKTVGYFGGKSARVLWVGAGDNCEGLLRLQQDIEERLDSAGWPKEARKFTGHLTLCRIRSSQAGVKLAQLAETYKDFNLGTITADSVCVYQSQLTPQGPIYTLLGRYKLS
jgi:2'-5' RNA ligase